MLTTQLQTFTERELQAIQPTIPRNQLFSIHPCSISYMNLRSERRNSLCLRKSLHLWLFFS